MTQIQPNTHGQVQRARKRLNRHLNRLKNADHLTVEQRIHLYGDIISDLVQVQQHITGTSANNDSFVGG